MLTKSKRVENGRANAYKRWGFRTLKERFESLVKKGKESECWIWLGSKNAKGYGRMWIGNKKTRTSHRVSFEIFVRTPDQSECVLHKCDNPSCVNPDHLFVGTVKDNSDDMISKGRERHLYGESLKQSKLNTSAIRAIRATWGENKTMAIKRTLAKKFGVKLGTIDDVVYGKTWNHVQPV